jgi:hypothetical protein
MGRSRTYENPKPHGRSLLRVQELELDGRVPGWEGWDGWRGARYSTDKFNSDTRTVQDGCQCDKTESMGMSKEK